MGRSTVLSSIVVATAITGFLCLAPPAPASPASASHANGGADAPRASSLRIYGAYLPDRVEWDETHWGFGIAARTSLNPRWGIDVGAARFKSSHRALTPMTIGFSYGPEARKGPRPWVEFGVGLYRLESTTSTAVVAALSSDGALFDRDAPVDLERRRDPRRNNAGGYLGVGSTFRYRIGSASEQASGSTGGPIPTP